MNSTSSSTFQVFNIAKTPNLIAATLMTINCIFGMFCNGSILYIFLKDTQQRTSFNLSCFVRAFNNLMSFLTAFVLVYIPETILGYSLLPSWLESLCICISLNFYLFNEFQSVYISINRFISIYFPLYYNTICGISPTLFVHFVIFINRAYNVVTESLERTRDDKLISYSPEYLMFTAIQVTDNVMTIIISILFFVALGANLFTFARITMFYLKSGVSGDADNRRRVRQNIKLFFQTALQDSLFLIDNIFTFYMGGLINHRFWYFICATFIWQTVHVLDGLIMIMFNDRLSFLKSAFFSSSVQISAVDTTVIRNI